MFAVQSQLVLLINDLQHHRWVELFKDITSFIWLIDSWTRCDQSSSASCMWFHVVFHLNGWHLDTVNMHASSLGAVNKKITNFMTSPGLFQYHSLSFMTKISYLADEMCNVFGHILTMQNIVRCESHIFTPEQSCKGWFHNSMTFQWL